MAQPGFWDDNQSARETARHLDRIKTRLKKLEQLGEMIEECEVYFQLGEEEEQDMADEVEPLLDSLSRTIDNLELMVRMNGKYDENNAILAIHPGAGGTESQDWAEMLLRMYERYLDKEGFEKEIIDFLAGEEAGIKRVTFLVKGDYAFGYLKSERGVHRLVRISPFDSSGRRHTSFASVDVLPELDEDVELDIKDTDLKIETYRASGAGGQHVNKTESAVRITHKPTGTVVQCQNERSQHKNKKMAMKILKSRLLEMKEKKQAEKIEELRGEKREIAWGSQIRSYVFHPYNKIKDHRTGFEEGNVDKVMDGELDEFIEAYLQQDSKGD